MKFKVVKRCHEDLGSIYGLLKSFLPFARKRMGFNKPPTIFFQSDQGNAQKLLGKTAHYEPATGHITVYVTGRHPKDVLRSLSHELVHHGQNCRGEFGHTPDTAPGYAQADSHMRAMEEEAYKVGNLCFRDWEDGVKTGKIRMPMALKESVLREQEKTYTIKDGDTLSGIAGVEYGDVHMWPLIYKSNEGVLGDNPDFITPGTEIVIPNKAEFKNISDSELESIYMKSNYYGVEQEKPESATPEELGISSSVYASSGSPADNALLELKLWRGKKEKNPKIQERLAAMWANVGVRRWSTSIPWSAAAISWFFRADPSFPRSTSHQGYIEAAKRNRRADTPGYRYYTPEELNYEYEINDIIGHIPPSYGKVHCDIYVGNNYCIGGNLSNTVKRVKVRKNKVSGNKIVLVIRKVNDGTLQEWKNNELNRLLLEKFNLGVKK